MQQLLPFNRDFLSRTLFMFALILLSFTTQAQVKLEFANPEFDGDNVKVDLVASNFTDIISMQFSIHYNPSFLEFVSTGDFNLPSLNQSGFGAVNNGRMGFSWSDPNIEGITVSDGTTLFSMTFKQLTSFAGEVNLGEEPTISEIIGFVNGEITELQLNDCGLTLRPANVTGNVFLDRNEDCTLDSGDDKLQGWKIAAVNAAGDVRFASTNAEGDFKFSLDPGNYNFQAIQPNDLWINCSDPQLVNVEEEPATLPVVSLGQTVTQECPIMNVSVGTPFVRRCFPNTYTVQYCNLGTATAEDASIEVTLDPTFEYISSTIPVASQDGNVLTFNLNSLSINQCGDFKIEVQAGCDGVELGQTHCVMAHAFPDEPCKVVDPLWSGANIEVTGECTGEEVQFTITNTGDDMDAPSRFIVSQDVIMISTQPFQLEAGASQVVSLAADGSSYRLAAEQVIANPQAGVTIAAVEGCGTNAAGTVSTGIVNQFPLGDEDPWISIDCQENIGAYDPNDKNAYPKGFGEQKFIEANTDLEYKIRFQNTGTDTAFNIVVIDELSAHLDAKTVIPGASSHPYQFELSDAGTLIFTFENIMLPDSNVNEAASNGFVVFNIKQQVDNPLGTIISNDAAIYFDFNEPIITNEVQLEIGEDYVEIVDDINEVDFPEADVQIFPNPFTENTTIKIAGVDYQEVTLNVYNTQGQLVRQQTSNSNELTFQRKGLNSGLYLFEMMIEGKTLSHGKVMVK